MMEMIICSEDLPLSVKDSRYMPAPGGSGVYQCVQNSSNALFLLGYYHARERAFVKLANNDKT